jgi:TniQ
MESRMKATPTLPWGDRTAGIAGGDPRWTETLPHRVVPQEDEWLPGLLARCDEANGWPAGTVARLLCPRQTAGYRLASPAHFVTAPGLDLAYLATLLALPLGRVEATTWRQALTRLHGTLLSTGEVGRLLAPPFVFLVCPRCVAEHRLLARWLALPLLGSCPRHGVLLRRRCRCGAGLHPFRRTALPFICAECRRPWAALPAQRATSAQRTTDRRTLTLFTKLLDGGPALVADARRLLQAELYARGWDQFPDQAIGSVALPAGPRWARAPTEVVASLTVLSLSVEQLLAAGPAGHGQPRCRNHACALFDVPGVGNLHSAGRRQGVPESYCDDCGARFLGDRVYSAFDDAAARGAGTPHPKTIARAQRRLAIWRRQLEEVCVRLLAADAPIRVANALRTAGIPRSPYLRARRLGLLAIAQHYSVLQSVLLPAVTPTASGPAGGRPAPASAGAGLL